MAVQQRKAPQQLEVAKTVAVSASTAAAVAGSDLRVRVSGGGGDPCKLFLESDFFCDSIHKVVGKHVNGILA